MADKASCRREYINARETPREVPDPTPVAMPVSTHRPLTLREEMQRFIKAEFLNRSQTQEVESFEEADDYSIDDEEDDLTTPYTVVHEMTPEPETAPLDMPETADGPTDHPPGDPGEPVLKDGGAVASPKDGYTSASELTNNATDDTLSGSA